MLHEEVQGGDTKCWLRGQDLTLIAGCRLVGYPCMESRIGQTLSSGDMETDCHEWESSVACLTFGLLDEQL